MVPRLMAFRLPEIWDGFAAWLFRCSNRKIIAVSSRMQPPSIRSYGNRILAAVACSCRSSGAEIHDPHAPTLPFPRTFPASSLRSEAAEPPSLDEAFNMQSPCNTTAFFPPPFVIFSMQPPFVMDRLFALATRLHTSLFPSADPMTASRHAPRTTRASRQRSRPSAGYPHPSLPRERAFRAFP